MNYCIRKYLKQNHVDQLFFVLTDFILKVIGLTKNKFISHTVHSNSNSNTVQYSI